jgi:hypothetical protein
MPEQSPSAEAHGGSPDQARAELHRLIEQLTDEEATALWRLICSWVAEGTTARPPRRASPEQP